MVSGLVKLKPATAVKYISTQQVARYMSLTRNPKRSKTWDTSYQIQIIGSLITLMRSRSRRMKRNYTTCYLSSKNREGLKVMGVGVVANCTIMTSLQARLSLCSSYRSEYTPVTTCLNTT